MPAIVRWAWAWWLTAALCVCAPCGAQSVLRVGLNNPEEGFLAASFKEQFGAAGAVFKKRHGVTVQTTVINGIDEFFAAAEKNRFDFLFSVSEEIFLRLMQTGRFEPLLTYELFDQPRHRFCLYVNAQSGISQVSQLKNKPGMTYSDEYAYLVLQDLLGHEPLSFFSDLKTIKGGVSAAYALSLNQVDAALVHDFSIGQMKRFNPGPLKKIKVLRCAEPLPPSSILVAKNLSPTLRDKFRNELFRLSKDKAYAQFHKMLKTLGVKFIPVKTQDFAPMFRRYEKGKNSAALNRFRQWRK